MTGFKTLNENQRTAVDWADGPLLVLAGPGSGKTTVLALRVAKLIEADDRASVLALTFTDGAAAEMREQVDRLLGQRADRVRVRTIHGFATNLLRQHGNHVGLRPDFILLTKDEDRIAVLEEAIAKLPDGTDLPPADRKNLLHLVDRLFAESYDGGPHAPSLPNTPSWIPIFYQGYCESLLAANRMDFGSLVHFARRLLAERPGVARVLRISWPYVCVDEFQDTTRAQYELLRLVASAPRRNLSVAADDDRMIHPWNGAGPERLDTLRRDYQPTTIRLPECYRCPPSIVTLANRLIAHNTLRTAGKESISAHSIGTVQCDVVRYQILKSPEKESEFVSQDLIDRKLRPADCVVLARTIKLIEGAAVSLRKAGFDIHVPQRIGEFESPAVCTILHALRLANARHDRTILRRLCLAWNALSGAILESENVAAGAALVGGDFLRSWADAAVRTATTKRTAKALDTIRSDLVDALAFPAVVDAFLDSGWKEWSGDSDAAVTSEEIETWRTLHDEIMREHGAGIKLHDYLPQLGLTSKERNPGKDAVRCMTVHRAKGPEFKHVYLIGLAQEVLPSFQALRRGPHSSALEDERRNCFLAITRASETLTLTRSLEYHGHPKGPSQFLTEMGLGECADRPAVQQDTAPSIVMEEQNVE